MFSLRLYVGIFSLSSNDATADKSGENLGSRSISLYDNEVLTLVSGITNEVSIPVQSINSAAAITKRFPLGSYIYLCVCTIINFNVIVKNNNCISPVK